MENNQTQNLPKTHRKPSTIQTNYQKTLRKILKEKNIRTELDQEILDTDNKRVMSITINYLRQTVLIFRAYAEVSRRSEPV